MIASLPSRVRQGIAVGLLVLTIGVLVGLIVAPLSSWVRSELDQRELDLKELAKLKSLVNAEHALHALANKLDDDPTLARAYRAESAAAAENEFQQDLRGLADKSGIAIDTLQPLEPAQHGAFTILTARIGFTTTVDHVGTLLAALPSASHLVQFQNLYITSPMGQSTGSNAALVVRGDITAYIMPASNQ